MKKKKTNFAQSILVTLKASVVGIITYVGYRGLDMLFPERPAVMIIYGLFMLWFWGFLANRLWGFK